MLCPAVLATAGVLLLVACGDETTDPRTGGPVVPAPPTGANVVDAGYDGRFRAAVTVLESPEHGPQLCDTIMDSYPPQCAGPDIVGWDWGVVGAQESASGTTWGSYIITGTWDGQRFTLTETPRPNDGSLNTSAVDPDFSSPCPEPEGGWRPVDPAKATEEALGHAFTTASRSPDYAGGWTDQSYLDELGGASPNPSPNPSDIEGVANDPARLVLNLMFTRSLAEHEQEIREVWGGALCVSLGVRSEAELLDIQSRLHADFPEISGSGPDIRSGVLAAHTMVATTTMQSELDARYGDGAVVLHGYLQPID